MSESRVLSRDEFIARMLVRLGKQKPKKASAPKSSEHVKSAIKNDVQKQERAKRPTKRVVRSDGRVYLSLEDALNSIGLSSWSKKPIRQAIANGTPYHGFLWRWKDQEPGVSSSDKFKHAPKTGANVPKPLVRDDGKIYRSMREALVDAGYNAHSQLQAKYRIENATIWRDGHVYRWL